jgi:hypothetical protein
MDSVAEHVVRQAPCPVLTVSHPEREFISPEALVARAHALAAAAEPAGTVCEQGAL